MKLKQKNRKYCKDKLRGDRAMARLTSGVVLDPLDYNDPDQNNEP